MNREAMVKSTLSALSWWGLTWDISTHQKEYLAKLWGIQGMLVLFLCITQK